MGKNELILADHELTCGHELKLRFMNCNRRLHYGEVLIAKQSKWSWLCQWSCARSRTVKFLALREVKDEKTNWSLRITLTIVDYKCEIKNFIFLDLLRRRLSATCAIGANFTFATAKTSLPKATSLRYSRNFTALHAPQFHSPHSFFYPQRNLWLQFMTVGQFIASSRCNPAFRIPKKTVILG